MWAMTESVKVKPEGKQLDNTAHCLQLSFKIAQRNPFIINKD